MNQQYTEQLLHWIWKTRHLDYRRLQTTEGQKIIIHDPGRPNQTDGPDFTQAHLTIDALQWFGDIEIHWKNDDWYHHSHHKNERYNRVILHIVFEPSKAKNYRPTLRSDGTSIPILCLKPFLQESLRHFSEQFQQPTSLPCASNVHEVPDDTFLQQIEEAHKQYFEQKKNDLLALYNPALPVSQAWENLIITALFDGLGIAHNRQPMQKLAGVLLKHFPDCLNLDELKRTAIKTADLETTDSTAPYHWNRKGARPANHPKNRILQACELCWYIKEKPVTYWLHHDIHSAYRQLIDRISVTPALGRQRADILFGTVWLPGLHILGDLLASSFIKQATYQLWMDHRVRLPQSITKHFRQSGISSKIYAKKLGSVYQFRTFCNPRNCTKCKVFKKIISS